VRTRLLSFGLVLVLAFLLLISLVVSASLAVLERYMGGIWSSSAVVLSTIPSLFSFGVIACLFAVIYKMLPDVQLSWRDVWTGAIFTAGLFSLGKYAIGLGAEFARQYALWFGSLQQETAPPSRPRALIAAKTSGGVF
jgi:membrane protein